MTRSILILLLATLPLQAALPQSGGARHFLFLDDKYYDLVDFWINNGDLHQPFVLNQPYTLSSLRSGLSANGRWPSAFRSHLDKFYGKGGSARLILYGRDQASMVSNGDLPIARALRSASNEDIELFENRNKNHYNFIAHFNLALPHLSLVNRTSINSEFLDDALYPGDTGEWIYGRNDDAYANANAGNFDLFYGKIDRNWGTLGSPSLILSDNPYSYDQAMFSYTSRKVKFSMLVTRLEDMLGRDFQGTYPDSLFESRRFLTAHRLDISLSPRLQFAFTEAVMYGGPDRDLEFGLLNPMATYYLVQRNSSKQLNGIWAADLFYKPARRWNIFLQLLIDDFILNNDEPDERDRHPDRLGIYTRVSQAGAWIKGLQTGLEYARIGNRTYQTYRTWENMNVHGKGLGYPSASIESISFYSRYIDLFPAVIEATVFWQRAGDVRVTDIFSGEKAPAFPAGVVEKTLAINFDARYHLNDWSRFTVRLGFSTWRNYNHTSGLDAHNFLLILGLQVRLSTGFSVL